MSSMQYSMISPHFHISPSPVNKHLRPETQQQEQDINMMDEIELQLCLSIDPTPISTPIKETDNQKEKQKRTSQQGQTQQLQILGAKRLAENLVNHGESGTGEEGRGLTHRDISPNFGDGDGDGDGDNNRIPNGLWSEESNDHLGYLQLPPRKKVRTLFAWDPESTCQTMSEGSASAESDTDKDKNHTPNHAAQSADVFDPMSLCHPLGDTKPPSSEEPGEYMHALIASLQLLNHPHPHPDPPDIPRRPQRFEIYEDPDDMDTDGVGFFNVDLNTACTITGISVGFKVRDIVRLHKSKNAAGHDYCRLQCLSIMLVVQGSP